MVNANKFKSSNWHSSGGGGVLNKCLCPEVQLLTLLQTIFHKQGTPFLYVLLTNGTPVTYLV